MSKDPIPGTMKALFGGHTMSTQIWNDEQNKPLAHLRILDCTVMLPGPYLTRILAQYGAEIIKVENLRGGDPIRTLRDTGIAEWLNQGKRSVGVDLKSKGGIELVRQLAADSDVFVENFREGVMEDLGLGYKEISRLNPDLLYVSLRGFQGKNAAKAGHDQNFVATSGCGEWFLENGPNYATHWGDLVGGTLAPAVKVLAHLSNPDRRGMHLVSYMDEAFRSLFIHRAYDAVKAEEVSEAERPFYGSHHSFNGTQPHSRYYRCQDATWVSVNAVQDKHWDRFCELVARPQWRGRAAEAALVAELTALFAEHPGAYWDALTAGHDLCVFKVTTWAEHLAEPSVREKVTQDPLYWAGFAANPDLGPAPMLGADTYSVLHEMGLSEEEFAKYSADGVIAYIPPSSAE
jgi:alpha-methylacyl-CoA racemase